MNTSLACVWIALLMWQPVTTELRQGHFHVLQSGTRPSNGRSISTLSGRTATHCAMMCLSDPSCTSFTLREAASCQPTCELRDQRGVTDTLPEVDFTASYFTKQECGSSPCQHGGTCIEGLDRHTCQCPAGFTGSKCETGACSSNPCASDATCSSVVGGYMCICDTLAHRDCTDVRNASCSVSGVYTVTPSGGSPINVYCDMDTDGGAWLVFQERHNGTFDFYLNWESYAAGFGDPNEEFWLGNRNLHLLTNQMAYTLRVDLGDWEGNQRDAQYSSFTVASEIDKFRLTLATYSGDAGNAMGSYSGMQFSTRDQDNDVSNSVHCAQERGGAWWYRYCSHSNLNGHYYPDGPYTTEQSQTGVQDGLRWTNWKGDWYSLRTSKMMIRLAP